MKVLYICSSQFSGTTLTSFLLNCHSSIATIGHTTGWRYNADEDFRCSCGSRIRDCRLFTEVKAVFEQNDLLFDAQNFGTAFVLSENARMNQLLIGPLPRMRSSRLERLRDRVVASIPQYRRRLDRQLLANFLLMQTVLRSLNASVYLDNSHSPYRLRMLSRNPLLDVHPVHLIRDPRGVTLSLMTNSGLGVSEAIESWIKHQLNIYRIANEKRAPLIVSYESLCRQTETELARLHRFVAVDYEPYGGDFKDKEHHILGNRMRLSDGVIRLDERWRRDLSKADLAIVERKLQAFQTSNKSHPLAMVVRSYLDSPD